MLEKIAWEVVFGLLGLFLSGMSGFLSAKVKEYKRKDAEYKKRDKIQEEALKCILRSNITSKYYVYTELKEIPYYEKENINYMHEQYKSMGGNSYIDEIITEINRLPIKK